MRMASIFMVRMFLFSKCLDSTSAVCSFKDGDSFLITTLMHLEVEHRGHEDREELLLFIR